MSSSSNSYVITTKEPRELARLRMQADAMADDAEVLLERIDVQPGWRCLDLACGCGGITDLMAKRAGARGRVVGLDRDPTHLATARQWAAAKGLEDGIEFVEGDVRASGLARDAFDLVHLRFILIGAGQTTETLREALALTRPGGILAAQEPDIVSLRCYPPHPAWDRLIEWVEPVLEGVPDRLAGDELYQRLLDLGLEDVQFRPFVVGFDHRHAMADFLPTTMESLKDAVLAMGLTDGSAFDATVAACRAHLQDPRTVSVSYMVVQVWGRKPG